jgi:hypothetical protein
MSTGALIFTRPSTLEKWFPAIIRHPVIFLSSTCLVSTWLDMKQGLQGDSLMTAMLKNEIYAIIQDRLQDRQMGNDDTTIMGILHLLAGEMWDCCEINLDKHVKGVAALIANRGGLNRLSRQNQTLAEVAIRYALDALSMARMNVPLLILLVHVVTSIFFIRRNYQPFFVRGNPMALATAHLCWNLPSFAAPTSFAPSKLANTAQKQRSSCSATYAS